MLKKTISILALALAATLAGCQAPGTTRHKQEIKLAPGKVLIVPFREAGAYYYDSQPGTAIADGAVKSLLEGCDRVSPVDYSSVRGLIRTDVMDDGLDIDWQQVGKTAKADYVVYGSLDSIGWQDKFDPGLLRCNFLIAYKVLDVKSGKQLYAVTKSGFYPTAVSSVWTTPGMMPTQAGLEPRAYEYIGSLVAMSFYSCTVQKRDEAAVKTQVME